MLVTTEHVIPIDLEISGLGIRGKPQTEEIFEKIRKIARSSKWRTGGHPDIFLVIEKDGRREETRCGNSRFATDRLLKIDRSGTSAWIAVRDTTSGCKNSPKKNQ